MKAHLIDKFVALEEAFMERQRIKKIASMMEGGMSVREIARIIGVTDQEIEKMLRESKSVVVDNET